MELEQPFWARIQKPGLEQAPEKAGSLYQPSEAWLTAARKRNARTPL